MMHAILKILKYKGEFMRKSLSCLQCKNLFIVKYYNRSKFCSRKCATDSGITVAKIIFWKKATYEQKIERIKKSFDKKVIKKDGCWSWNGSLLSRRGVVNFNNKPLQAHRASWMIHFGPIPQGLFVLHKCDNEICSNPNHLFLGTVKDNCIDALLKDRCPQAKLKIEQVKEIKKLISEKVDLKKIANQFDINLMTIRDIKYNKTWRYV